MEHPMLDDLPTVIDGPGDYVTRNGRRVTIHEIKPGSTFAAKGSIWKTLRGRTAPRGYSIWHVSGRSLAVGTSPADIVARQAA